mmetsp:Transcript_39700/g.67668  ORF Transcript_39700/g.67668 Transcript_39700/m.67668 type:complete len:320 (+) Transcript_39700:304-1263(+)
MQPAVSSSHPRRRAIISHAIPPPAQQRAEPSARAAALGTRRDAPVAAAHDRIELFVVPHPRRRRAGRRVQILLLRIPIVVHFRVQTALQQLFRTQPLRAQRSHHHGHGGDGEKHDELILGLAPRVAGGPGRGGTEAQLVPQPSQILVEGRQVRPPHGFGPHFQKDLVAAPGVELRQGQRAAGGGVDDFGEGEFGGVDLAVVAGGAVVGRGGGGGAEGLRIVVVHFNTTLARGGGAAAHGRRHQLFGIGIHLVVEARSENHLLSRYHVQVLHRCWQFCIRPIRLSFCQLLERRTERRSHRPRGRFVVCHVRRMSRMPPVR